MADFIDKAKHQAEKVGGEAKEKLGKATGDRDLEAEGNRDQASGKVKRAGDKVTDAVDDLKDKFKN